MAAQVPTGGSAREVWWRRPVVWLALVAVLHAASPLLLLGVHWWFGVDETVYLSQVNKFVQPGFFSAPRARGPTLIAAPVTLYTSSTGAVRLWLSLLSGAGLFLGFAPWLRLRRGWVVPLAAGLFATLWTVIYYGFTVMPNEWVAYGSIAACGLVITFLVEGRRRTLLAASCAVALVALFRPSDAVYLVVGLVLAGLFIATARRRRLACVAGLAIGLLGGVLEWLIEAQIRYGGIIQRVHAAQAENGGGGLHFAGAAQARALAGPTLCRNGCHASAPIADQLWWLALAAIVTVGVVSSRRQRRVPIDIIATTVGLVLAGQYIFGITYAAPRFLIPAYALFAIPFTAGIADLTRRLTSRTARTGAFLFLTASLVVHVELQVNVITHNLMPGQRREYHGFLATARHLRRLGIHSPCLVTGSVYDAQMAYATGCTNAPEKMAGVVAELGHGGQVVWLSNRLPPDRRGVLWTRIRPLPTSVDASRAYLGHVAAVRLDSDDD